jgi:maltodextrin utilization protein YvdJ
MKDRIRKRIKELKEGEWKWEILNKKEKFLIITILVPLLVFEFILILIIGSLGMLLFAVFLFWFVGEWFGVV